MSTNLIGVDFSLNSPAFCTLCDGKFSWTSVTRSDRNVESLTKNKKKPFSVLSESEDFNLVFMDKKEIPDEYSARERTKMLSFIGMADAMGDLILKDVGDKEFKIAMEGLSFSSNGNALIDISMATALLRLKIISKIGAENFYVFSPTSIKKFAHKGNAKKDELYESLIKLERPETNLNNFTKLLESNQIEWVTPAKQVNKPIDDLVDATWIALYLESILKSKQ